MQLLHCRNYNQDTDEEEDEEESEEEYSEEDEEEEEENDYKAMGHSCEYQREKIKPGFHKTVSPREGFLKSRRWCPTSVDRWW